MKNMRLKVLTAVLALVLMFSLSAQAMAGNAFVWANGNGGGNTAGVAAWIMASGYFSAVDYSDADMVPLGTLLLYDAVLYFSNGSSTQDPVAVGDVLADYADTGRRLVLATFAWADQGSNTLAGRIIDDAISPFALQGVSLYSNVTMASNDGHPFFSGVATLDGYYHDDVSLVVGAQEHATWSDGEPLMADKGNVAAINLFPDDVFGQIGGDYRALFANSLRNETVPIQAMTWGLVKSEYSNR